VDDKRPVTAGVHHIGLHHLALRVGSEQGLKSLHDRLLAAGVKIEFSPEQLRGGPAMHMMCYDPGGIRIEFICAP